MPEDLKEALERADRLIDWMCRGELVEYWDMPRDDLVAALHRADKLIDWMAKGIGRLAPGDYPECYSDLNEHFLFMEQLKRREGEHDKAQGKA